MQKENLVAKLQAGNQAAFRQLIDLYQARVFSTCLSFVFRAEDAEDLTQEVFVEVFRSVKRFQGKAKLSTWIYRIAVTKSLEHIRKFKRQKRAGHALSLSDLSEIGYEIPARAGDHPGLKLENKERAATLFKAIAQLPEKQKVAFTLNKIEGRSYQEVADLMEMTLASIEALIFRARKALKKDLVHMYKNQS